MTDFPHPLTHRAMLARYAEVPPVAPPEPRWRIYWPAVAVWIGLPLVAWWLVIVAAKALAEAALVAAGG